MALIDLAIYAISASIHVWIKRKKRPCILILSMRIAHYSCFGRYYISPEFLKMGKSPGYCTNSSIRHDDGSLPSRTADIESATNFAAVLYAPRSDRHMNKCWPGSHTKPRAQYLISPAALDICFLKVKKCVAIGDLCISASCHAGITKISFHIFNEISDCSSSEDTRSQVPESRLNPRVLHSFFHQAWIWQFVIPLPLQTWNCPQIFPLSCILLEVTGNWISTDQQVTQNQEHIILSSPVALDNYSLKDKTCVTLGELCISASNSCRNKGKIPVISYFQWEVSGYCTVSSIRHGNGNLPSLFHCRYRICRKFCYCPECSSKQQAHE